MHKYNISMYRRVILILMDDLSASINSQSGDHHCGAPSYHFDHCFHIIMRLLAAIVTACTGIPIPIATAEDLSLTHDHIDSISYQDSSLR